MKFTYLFHSGFVLEAQHSIVVFDYWFDPADAMPRFLLSDKSIYVLSSHFHKDHFTRRIFRWREQHSKITYILSKDILRHCCATQSDADVWMVKGSEWQDENLRVRATGSNDSGVSWIVEVDGKRIFHAGDLGNWFARFLTDDYQGGEVYSAEFNVTVNPHRMEQMYLGELKDIRKLADGFDIAMLPVDGRIGNGYTRGARQFIERFDVGLFVPMHFTAAGFESAWRMKEYTEPRNIPFWAIAAEGESREISK